MSEQSFDKNWDRAEITRLTAELAKFNKGGCTLAGLGRGDCEHFIGLPGKSIPGQHNGDDTVDVYGKPNGWCWSCWKSHQLAKAREEVSMLRKTWIAPNDKEVTDDSK